MPTNSFFVSKKKLRSLYEGRRWSSYKIAKELGVSQGFIWKKLLQYRVKTRGWRESKSCALPRYPRKDFSNDLSEKAYLLGFRAGDLHVSQTSRFSPTIRVSVNTTRPEQVTLFNSLFQEYGHVKIHEPDRKGAQSCRAYLNKSFKFLLKKPSRMPKWVKRNSRSLLNFLAGYIDAEGTFCMYTKDSPVFSIKSQDKNLLRDVYLTLSTIGSIKSPPYLIRKANSVHNGVKSNKDVFGLCVYRKGSLLSIITNLLPFLRHVKRRGDALKVLKFIHGRA
ncbi:MAG: hypothetical protein HYW80_01100 [Parcubacteria group bacterium]|nr:hypothetical protein [Parcubacteria group bacterium]